MATQLKPRSGSDADLWQTLQRALRHEDGAAAREQLTAGLPVYYSEVDTPEGVVIKEYPDGRRELVRFDQNGEHRVAALA